ncbi:MAG TPA: hypothetical protein VFD88_12370, partial [Clostridia bacterium]|nr:hypothetical protein [Clostridia bacterium]
VIGMIRRTDRRRLAHPCSFRVTEARMEPRPLRAVTTHETIGSNLMDYLIPGSMETPNVTVSLLNRLLDLQEESGLPAAALSFNGLLHPPVVLKRELWGDLMALEGDVGCRAVIRARPELVARLPFEQDRVHPVDVDTPEDYERFVRGRYVGGVTGTNR